MKKMKKLVVAVMLLCMLAGMTVCAGPSRRGIIWADNGIDYEVTTADGRTVPAYLDVYNADQMTDQDTVKSLTGWEDFTAHFFEYGLYGSSEEYDDRPIESLGSPVTIPVYFSGDSGVKEGDEVKVILLKNGNWEMLDSSSVRKISLSETETYNGIDIAFPIPESSAAVIIKKSASGSGSGSHSGGSSGSSSGGGSSSSSAPAPYVNPVTVPNGGVAAGIAIGGISYDALLHAGPTTRTFSERDAATMLGIDGPCRVYLMDLWLENQNNPGEVLTLSGEGTVLTLNVPNVNPNCKVMIRHWLNGTDEYEDLIPEEIGNGYIKIRFTSLSPIAICVQEAPASAAPTTGNTRLSPKTGGDTIIFLAEGIAVFALLGFVVSRRRYGKK